MNVKQLFSLVYFNTIGFGFTGSLNVLYNTIIILGFHSLMYKNIIVAYLTFVVLRPPPLVPGGPGPVHLPVETQQEEEDMLKWTLWFQPWTLGKLNVVTCCRRGADEVRLCLSSG